MSISGDILSDDTCYVTLLLRQQYEFPFGINKVQFSFFPLSMGNYWNLASREFDLEKKVQIQNQNIHAI